MSSFSGDQNLFDLNQEKFDFNVNFEQLFFTIIPSALFIPSSFWWTFSQLKKPTIVYAPFFQVLKLGAIASYVGLELSLLILTAVGLPNVSGMFIASSIIRLVSALSMITLSFIDHSKSPKPSLLLTGYLVLTLILDATQTRTLFLSSDGRPEFAYSSIFSAALALKAAILILESKQKSKWLSWDANQHSPEETSGIFSIGVFFWLNKIFLRGYSKVLRVKDLYPLDIALDSKTLHEKYSQTAETYNFHGRRNGLFKVILRTLNIPFLLPVIPRLAQLGFTFAQPFFIEQLLEHLSKPKVEANDGYGFIGASVLIYAGIAISTALVGYFQLRTRAMVRSILVTEIFSKATKIRIGSGDDGAAVTLMSTDMERIDMGLRMIHDMWASIIQAGLASWMLYKQLGPVFLAPIGLVAGCFLALGVLMKFTGDSQKAWMDRVQKRVGLTSKVIGNMKNLKISGLTLPIRDFVQNLRVEELASGAHFRKIYILSAALGFTPLQIGPPLTFAIAQTSLGPTKMFTSLSYLLLLTNPLLMIFQGLPQLLSGLACFSRIQQFLECEDRDDFRMVLADIRRNSTRNGADETRPADSTATDPIVITNGNFGWEKGDHVLRDVSTRVPKSSLTIVVGPVGSGKSTFCKALLGEVPYKEGRVIMSSRFPHVGYCDQTPFLSNGSVRDNIVGFTPFDSARYTEIIEATGLNVDLATLPKYDNTNVGSDGITLSGGQKQRVALARALYLQSDLLVFDDIFSGLDANTEEYVFRQVFGPDGLLRRRRSTVVLCTHSVRHLPAADHIIALGNGSILEQGDFKYLMSNHGYVYRLGLKAISSNGALSEKMTPEDSPRDPKPLILHHTTTNTSTIHTQNGSSRRHGDRSVYKHYFKSMGFTLVTVSMIFAIGWGFFSNFPTIWLKYWSGDVEMRHSHSYYAGIYALMQTSALISIFCLGTAIHIVSIKKAGASLHQDALRTLVRAPLGFLTSTDTGVITNLFSQDLNLIDTELPSALLNVYLSSAQAVGQAAVLPTSSPYMAISYPFLCVILYLVQRFYLRTSRQLRLLDLETKSPLYTHFLDTIKGLTTLRAFGFVPEELHRNALLINTSQRPAYLLKMIQQWLNLVLDLVVMTMAAVLVALAVLLHSNSGFTGASLITLMSFGESLSEIVIHYTRLETSIGAVGRLKAFNEDVKPEDKLLENTLPPPTWPEAGVVELDNVSASYDAQDDLGSARRKVLRDITLTINSGEKVAICGRTGSGKSSLVALLLKLLEPVNESAQNIFIDNTPLHLVERLALRERIIAVPQESVFLPDGSTFQANLDPFGTSTPEECQAVLNTIGLWDFVKDRGGLDAGMSAGTFSAGQRQLMSLGRALLRRRTRLRNHGTGCGILILDEVSANVDHETERLIMDIIRDDFSDYTVVAVSHRLDTIMDFDTVLFMDTGELVEIGNPKILANQEGTRFRELVTSGT